MPPGWRSTKNGWRAAAGGQARERPAACTRSGCRALVAHQEVMFGRRLAKPTCCATTRLIAPPTCRGWLLTVRRVRPAQTAWWLWASKRLL